MNGSLLRMDKLQKKILLPLFMTCSLIIHTISAATDTINSVEAVRDGETMVSSGGKFELGFFSPGNSTNRYVGIWYKNITVRTVIWVANRESPLPSYESGVLKVTQRGLLVILNDTSGIIWSSNTSRSVQNPVAQLLDSGNLVVRESNDDNPENYIWQSCDYLGNTYVPGMTFGWNFVTGIEAYLSSWKSDDDPAPGEFTLHLDPTGYPQILLKSGNTVHLRIGPWNGLQFLDLKEDIPTYTFTVWLNKNKAQLREDSINRSVISRTTIRQDGIIERLHWIYETQAWHAYVSWPIDSCDRYNLCGEYGICNIRNSPGCGCLDRFVPKDPDAWLGADWSSGCIRRTNLSCQGDVFLKYSGIKLPDTRSSRCNENLTLAQCKAECSRNCSCMAYAQLDIREGGSGCMLYHGGLVDIRTLSPAGGRDIYIRMGSSESENLADSKGKIRATLIASITSMMGMVLLCLSLVLCLQRRKKDQTMRKEGLYNGSRGKDSELQFFKLSTILKATDHFSVNNKLGEGGFGPVYKGMLEDGEEIAVKRLSKTSGQGVDELKNEMIVIAKLQHRNLVRLLGCCIQGAENMLIYEYMPNNSLDLILFEQTRSMLLDWPKRFHIINGIAKGLMYLHQDSRLRIIHRDLKASNILLDSNMNPKISDFGLARSFRGDETQAKTRRVVGTYGYMSPEYAIGGLFSVKSDVFSFGVLVLEIVSGKRNRGLSIYDHNLNLLGHAWTLYKEENSLELVDASLGDSYVISEVLRSIEVGLLCVQKCPEDRPSMSSVVSMLGNDVLMPQAKQPGFFMERDVLASLGSTSNNTANSVNEVTITWPDGR